VVVVVVVVLVVVLTSVPRLMGYMQLYAVICSSVITTVRFLKIQLGISRILVIFKLISFCLLSSNKLKNLLEENIYACFVQLYRVAQMHFIQLYRVAQMHFHI
jgi:hypothetical protein